jgi:pyruvate/oxaloacetate carboxyltransferase
MAKVIGTGDSAVKNFVNQCKAAGGIPIIRDKYGGNEFPNGEVVVACWGKASQVPGGTITNVSSSMRELLSSSVKGKYRQLM